MLAHSVLNRKRFRRKPIDPLDENLDQIRKISRITNDIYVYQGLTDGTIPPNAFISEILRLGPLTLPQIKTMDLAGSKKAVEDMSSFFLGLKLTDLEVNAEKRYLIFDKIRKSTGDIGDVAKLEGVDEYKTELGTLKTTKVDWKKLETFESKINDYHAKVNEIRDIKTDDPNFTIVLFAALVQLKPKIVAMEAAAKDIGRIPEFEKIRGSEKIFSPLLKVSEGAKVLESNTDTLTRTRSDATADRSYQKKITDINNVSSMVQVKDPVIKSVLSIFENRFEGPKVPLYTAGFINKESDLVKITDDLKDPRIQKVIVEANSLSGSLVLLEPIGESVTVISSSLGSSSQHKTALKSVIKNGESIVLFSGQATPLAAAMNGIYGCNLLSVITPPNEKEAQALLKNISKLQEKAGTLGKFTAMSNFILDNPTILTEISDLSGTVTSTSSKAELEKARTALIESESFKKVQEILKDSSASFKKLPSLSQKPEPSELAENILNNFSQIGDYQTNVATHATYFKCLHDVKHADLIRSGIDSLKKLRDQDVKPIQDGIKAIEGVERATAEFGTLESAVSALPNSKDTQNPAVSALKLLEDPSKHSATIGGATRGIFLIKSAIDSNSQFDVIKKHSNLVSEELKTVQNLPAKDAENLKKLDDLSNILDGFMNWKSGVTLVDATSLKDYSSFLSSAKSISGFDDLKELSDSVGVLESLVSDPVKKKSLNELRDALDSLHDLNLADHKQQFEDSGATLDYLDLFFAQYSAALNPTTTLIPSTLIPIQNSPLKLVFLDTTTMELTTVAAGFPTYGWLLIIGSVSLGAIASFGVLAYCFEWCCFKKKVESDDTLIEEQKVEEDKSKNNNNNKDPNPKVVDEVKAETKKTGEKEPEKKKNASKEEKVETKEEVTVKKEPVIDDNIVEPKVLPPKTGEYVLSAVYKILMNHQKNTLKIKNATLQEATLISYAAHILASTNNLYVKIVGEISPHETKQNRVQIYMIPEFNVILREAFHNRCFFPDDFTNFSLKVVPNTQRFFMTETPTTESFRDRGGRYTNDKFWYTAMQTGCNVIVMLSGKDELSTNYKNKDDVTEKGYGAYFPKESGQTITQEKQSGEKFTVWCKRLEKISEHLTRRTLVFRYSKLPPKDPNLIGDFYRFPTTTTESKRSKQSKETKEEAKEVKSEKTKEVTREEKVPSEKRPKYSDDELRKMQEKEMEEFKAKQDARQKRQFRPPNQNLDIEWMIVEIQHYEYTGWPKDSAPSKTDDILEIFDRIKKMKNVIVHCSDGVGRTGTFVTIALALQNLSEQVTKKENVTIEIASLIGEVRKSRNGAVTNDKEVAFILRTLVDAGYHNGQLSLIQWGLQLAGYGKQKHEGRVYLSKYPRFSSSYERIFNGKIKLDDEYLEEITEKMRKNKKAIRERITREKQDSCKELDKTQEDA